MLPSHQLGSPGSAVSSPAGFGAEPRPPKGFSLFSALRMASPDTMILLIAMEQTSSISSRSLSVGHLRVLSSIARL